MTESNQPLIDPTTTTHVPQDVHQKLFVPSPLPQETPQKLFIPNSPVNGNPTSTSMPNGSTNVSPNMIPNSNTCEIETQTNDFVIDLDGKENTSHTHNDIANISNYVVFDELGNRHSMGQIWSE